MEGKRLNTILGILAVIILITSCAAFAYSRMPKGDSSVIVVNGVEYNWDTVFQEFEMESFTANDNNYRGVALVDIIADANVQSPNTHTYRLTGLDGYEKDVQWSSFQNGYLIEEKHRAVFPDLTQSFWVRDLASIEVI